MSQQNTQNKEMNNAQGNGEKQSANGEQTQNKNGQQSQSKDKEGVRSDKGTGYFPLSDMEFDVVTLVYQKSKALQAYDKYLLDCQPNEELRSVVEAMKADDRKHVEQLKTYLGKCLSK